MGGRFVTGRPVPIHYRLVDCDLFLGAQDREDLLHDFLAGLVEHIDHHRLDPRLLLLGEAKGECIVGSLHSGVTMFWMTYFALCA